MECARDSSNEGGIEEAMKEMVMEELKDKLREVNCTGRAIFVVLLITFYIYIYIESVESQLFWGTNLT